MRKNGFCILCDSLPGTVRVNDNGDMAAISTRVSTAICCIRRMRQPGISQQDIMEYVCRVKYHVPVTEQVFSALMDFISGPPVTETKKEGKAAEASPQVLDFEQDADLIVCAFQQAYGIGLEELTDMHWWRFLALLSGLPEETRLMQTIKIRTMRVNPKDPPEVREAKRKAKAAVALRDTRTPAQRKADVQAQMNNLGL